MLTCYIENSPLVALLLAIGRHLVTALVTLLNILESLRPLNAWQNVGNFQNLLNIMWTSSRHLANVFAFYCQKVTDANRTINTILITVLSEVKHHQQPCIQHSHYLCNIHRASMDLIRHPCDMDIAPQNKLLDCYLASIVFREHDSICCMYLTENRWQQLPHSNLFRVTALQQPSHRSEVKGHTG